MGATRTFTNLLQEFCLDMSAVLGGHRVEREHREARDAEHEEAFTLLAIFDMCMYGMGRDKRMSVISHVTDEERTYYSLSSAAASSGLCNASTVLNFSGSFSSTSRIQYYSVPQKMSASWMGRDRSRWRGR